MLALAKRAAWGDPLGQMGHCRLFCASMVPVRRGSSPAFGLRQRHQFGPEHYPGGIGLSGAVATLARASRGGSAGANIREWRGGCGCRVFISTCARLGRLGCLPGGMGYARHVGFSVGGVAVLL